MGDEEEKTYEEIIKECADKDSNTPIANSTIEHARIASKYLINKAKKVIRIVTNGFYEEFWKDLENDIGEFIKKDPTNIIEVIIVRESEFKPHGTLGRINSDFPNRIVAYTLDEKKLEKKAPNFLTIDEKGYRYEYSDEKKKNKLVEGVINFGDAKNTTSLNSLFNSIRDKSSRIDF